MHCSLCISAGCVISSALVLYTYYWLLFILHLGLKLFYPLKSAKLTDSEYSRTIYITEILIVFLIGVIPSVIVGVIFSYSINTFPPLICGTFHSFFVYSTAFPFLVTTCINHIVMLLIIYRIHTVSKMV